MDIQTFIFQDFFLRIFDRPDPVKPYFINTFEFNDCLLHPLFPNATLTEILLIPSLRLDNSSYQQFFYHNISRFNFEEDFLYKFLEKKTLKKNRLRTTTRADPSDNFNIQLNSTINITDVSHKLFRILDYKDSGFIDFNDFGNFIQIAFLFSKFDEFGKGRVISRKLYEKYKDYSDFPRISRTMKLRAERFSAFNEDMYLDLQTITSIFRINQIMGVFVRSEDESTVNEVEMKAVLRKVSMEFVPEPQLNKCVKGLDKKNIPKYDWDCAFNIAVEQTCRVWEESYDRILARTHNETLLNSNFTNPWFEVSQRQNLTHSWAPANHYNIT